MQDIDATRPAAEEPLHLPLLGLYADLEIGQGSVSLPDAFCLADPWVRWRLLADWSAALATLQQQLQREHPEWGLATPASPPLRLPPARRG